MHICIVVLKKCGLLLAGAFLWLPAIVVTNYVQMRALHQKLYEAENSFLQCPWKAQDTNVCLCAIPGSVPYQASLSSIISESFLRFMSIESVMLPNHLYLCHSLLLLASVFLSIRVFSNESALCIRWPKYWNFSISPSNEYSGLISLRFDWYNLIAVQGTLKFSSATVQKHQFFGTQPSLCPNSHICTWLLEKP